MGLAALSTAALVVAGCGGSSHSSSTAEASATTAATSTTVTSTEAATTSTHGQAKGAKTKHVKIHVVTASTQTPPAPPKHQPAPILYTGSGTRDVGSFTIHYASYLDWKCAGNGAPFEINNSLVDASPINIDAAGAGSGTLVLQPGKYHKVTVTTSGTWTLSIRAVQ
jgi:hypothetical protein